MNKEEIKKALTNASKNINLKEDGDFKTEEQQAEKEFYSSIKNCVRLDKYRNILKYVELITRKDTKINCIVIDGSQGIGKSTVIKSILKEQNIDFTYLNSYSTALSFYISAYHNRNKVLLLDDLNGIFADKKGLSILRALINTEQSKFINYQSTSEKLTVPDKFIFKGKIIILCNDILEHIDESLLSRVIYRTVGFTHQEKLNLMKEIIGFNYKNLNEKQIDEISLFIEKNTAETTKNFSFRTINKIVDFYLNFDDCWKELALEELVKDEELSLVKKIISQYQTAKEQVLEYTNISAKSRASFFRAKKRLVSKSHQYQNGANETNFLKNKLEVKNEKDTNSSAEGTKERL